MVYPDNASSFWFHRVDRTDSLYDQPQLDKLVLYAPPRVVALVWRWHCIAKYSINALDVQKFGQ